MCSATSPRPATGSGAPPSALARLRAVSARSAAWIWKSPSSRPRFDDPPPAMVSPGSSSANGRTSMRPPAARTDTASGPTAAPSSRPAGIASESAPSSRSRSGPPPSARSVNASCERGRIADDRAEIDVAPLDDDRPRAPARRGRRRPAAWTRAPAARTSARTSTIAPARDRSRGELDRRLHAQPGEERVQQPRDRAQPLARGPRRARPARCAPSPPAPSRRARPAARASAARPPRSAASRARRVKRQRRRERRDDPRAAVDARRRRASRRAGSTRAPRSADPRGARAAARPRCRRRGSRHAARDARARRRSTREAAALRPPRPAPAAPAPVPRRQRARQVQAARDRRAGAAPAATIETRDRSIRRRSNPSGEKSTSTLAHARHQLALGIAQLDAAEPQAIGPRSATARR